MLQAVTFCNTLASLEQSISPYLHSHISLAYNAMDDRVPFHAVVIVARQRSFGLRVLYDDAPFLRSLQPAPRPRLPTFRIHLVRSS
ncbi:MAG TPA: hypothetical protein VKR06_09420, partial [Ktedonosporobacter sp.]|nr:hypothetical protein [Ktedonosporobacter sp.]